MPISCVERAGPTAAHQCSEPAGWRRLTRTLGVCLGIALAGCAQIPKEPVQPVAMPAPPFSDAPAPRPTPPQRPAPVPAPQPAAAEPALPAATAPVTGPATDPAAPVEPEVAAPETLTQVGLASWYGPGFHGRRTASGERFDMHAFTAAHRTLPLPSHARVRNPANGREVRVRINDRGPFHGQRILDLSYAAAVQLGVLHRPAVVEIFVEAAPAAAPQRPSAPPRRRR